jgi:hypothetical protein
MQAGIGGGSQLQNSFLSKSFLSNLRVSILTVFFTGIVAAVGAIPPELDVNAAYQDYLNEKADSDRAGNDFSTQKGIYDQANSELNAARSKENRADQSLTSAKSILTGIQTDLLNSEKQRANAVSEIDRIAIRISAVDSRITAEQRNNQGYRRDVQESERRIDRLERRISELERRPGSGDWTCTWVDKGSEEHRGGHRATDSDKATADKNAEEACKKAHGDCVPRGCTQPDNQELKQAKRDKADEERDLSTYRNQLSNSDNALRSLDNERIGYVNDDADQRARIRSLDTTIADYERKEANATRNVQEATDDLRDARAEVAQAKAYVNSVTPAYTTAKALYEREYAEMTAALNEYKRIQANYDAALNKVLAAAQAQAEKHAGQQADDRAGKDGDASGSGEGVTQANKKLASDIPARDKADGYADGRQNDALLATFASSYSAGLDEGRAVAVDKATKEEFAKGFNQSFAKLLSAPPAADVTLDAAVDASTESPGSGSFISASELKVGSVAPPSVTGITKPVLASPSITKVSVSSPSVTNDYYSPSCENLVLPEFKAKCEAKYDTAFKAAFASKYAGIYQSRYVKAYNAAADSTYQAALKSQKDSSALKSGQELGVKHRGILDGYAGRIAAAQAEQFKLGQDHLDQYLDQGALLVVRSAKLADTSGDGLITPTEKTGVTLVIDNYGKQSTRADALKLDVSSTSGLANSTAGKWLALPPSSRVTLKNAHTLDVTGNVAGSTLKADATVVRTDGGGSYGKLAATGQVGFPRELKSIDLERKPKLNEKVKAKFTFTNRTTNDLPEAGLNLRVSPGFMDVEMPKEGLKVPAMAAGQTAEVTANVTAKTYVGDNTNVQFVSEVIDGATIGQMLPKLVDVDRTAGMSLYDDKGQPVPDSTLRAQAGGTLTFQVVMKYNKATSSAGSIRIEAGATSDPGIKVVVGTSVATEYGIWTPGRKATPQVFRYTIPASLKGKTGNLMVNLKEGNVWLHNMTIYLNIE